jgi:exonuclease SbcC
MSAFGPYAGCQRIDFRRVGAGGIYLIAGDTGAGKSSIFDAISYALFGEASGRERSDRMLRSDFADPGAKTYVRLAFECGGLEYTAERSPEYLRPKSRGSGFTKEAAAAHVTLPDGQAVSGIRQANEKIEEILGINRDQFSQIVMIAQGDFRRFLLSETKDRAAILRRIFGTGRFKAFQEELKQKMLEHKRAFEDGTRSFLQYADGIASTEGFEAAAMINSWKESADIYKAGELASWLETLIGLESAAIDSRRSELRGAMKEQQESAAALAAIEAVNKLFDTLSSKTRQRDALSGRAPDMDSRQRMVDRGALALRNVKAYDDASAKASHSCAAAVKSADTAQADMAVNEKRLREAGLALAGEKGKEAERAQLRRDIDRLASQMPKYARLRELEAELGAVRQKSEAAGHAMQAAASKAAGLRAKAGSLKAEYDALEGTGLKLEKLAAEKRETLGAMQGLEALEGRLGKLAQKRARLKSLQGSFADADAAFGKADGAFRRLEQAFLREQAGLLALGLEDGAPCPVCGSPAHPAPAAPPSEAVSENEVAKARRKAEDARQRREALAGECSALKGEADAEGAACMAEAARAGLEGAGAVAAPAASASAAEAGAAPPASESAAEAGAAPPASEPAAEAGAASAAKSAAATEAGAAPLAALAARLPQMRAEHAGRLDGLSVRIAALEKDLARRNSCRAGLAAIEPEEKLLAEALAKAESELGGLKLAHSALEAEHGVLRGDLEYGSATEAEGGLGRKRSALGQMEAAYEKAESSRGEASAALERAEAVLKERLELASTSSGQMAAAAEEFHQAIHSNGFADEGDYRSALMTEDSIKAAQQEIDDYHKALALAEHDVAGLLAETAGKEYTDTGSLLPELEAMDARIGQLTESLAAAQSILDANKAAQANMADASDRMKSAEARYLDYKTLSDTANGDIGGKARLTFETYLQAAYFTRILHAANLRLSAMSSDRYEFRRREAPGNMRSQTGLELDVLDNYTGKARDVRTLSGGESFKASLALALGLSDIVQQTSGGVRLDAMFVDEGFGALDSESLDAAIATLEGMSGSNRSIGIISHVRELSERIDKQILVKRGAAGSEVSVAI